MTRERADLPEELPRKKARRRDVFPPDDYRHYDEMNETDEEFEREVELARREELERDDEWLDEELARNEELERERADMMFR